MACWMRGLKAADRVTIGHAEVLDDSHEDLGTRPLKRGRQVDEYLSDGTDAWWEPRFVMHGFRYAKITGIADLTADDIVCTVYHSVMRRTGWFETSNALVNRLHENTLWSMRSNFMSIPTDCPQRDERVGWTADIAVFSPTALYLYDVSTFLANWLEDVSFEQEKNGTVPFYIPYVKLGIWADPAAIGVWGDAAVLVPWAVYMATGDRGVLEANYQLATRWVDEVNGYLSPDGVWDRRPDYPIGQLGDWLDPMAPPDSPDQAMTAKELVVTAFHVHSLRLVAKMAGILGHADDETEYLHRAEHVAEGFRARFIGADGLMSSDTQCAYMLAIMFDLVDASTRDRFGERLVQLVRQADGKIGTGFAGTPYILPALTATGHYDEAYGLFMSTKCPSWLYAVTMGATTTWERWDSMLPDGRMNPGSMTSFNHYALGSVNDWAHAVIGGLAPLEPAWRTILVAPHPGGGLTHASSKHETPYGEASCAWTVEDGVMTVDITVPHGTTAVVRLLGDEERKLDGGEYRLSVTL
ncbi:family 78 glycoside hydrolase catalytic domain [Bifidobacterium pullorum subsp. saeculare]|uniref:alpha-L-rhamnosidase n=2 Tax=Bifidobacterium pullorum TaxID=78448 RepID=A0A939B8K4_9BIFI|nr:family 78 glycoside hydrolase catalytic domain [Bifidobacterium pullorum subsp. saeculare]